MPQIVARTVDQMVMTWLLTLVCSAHCFNNPYLVAKLVEVLFMMNPSVQVYKFFISSRFLSSFSFYNSFSLVRKRYMSGYWLIKFRSPRCLRLWWNSTQMLSLLERHQSFTTNLQSDFISALYSRLHNYLYIFFRGGGRGGAKRIDIL